MPELFETTWIRSLELQNRAIRSATWSGVGDDNGGVTERAVEFYRTLGEGEIGLIITGYQHVLPNGIHLPYTIGNSEDWQEEGLRQLTEAVHQGGGRIAAQLVHAGARANPRLLREGDEIWAPSAIPDPSSGIRPMEITKRQILKLVEAFAEAAHRSLKAGFDALQLHAAQGFAINQFLSPARNKRGDAYGGKISRRYRFLGEVLEAVRGAVGDDFPVLVKLSGHDYEEGGLVPDESLEVARRLVDDGVDGIEVSAGSAASPGDLGPIRVGIIGEEQEAYLAPLAARFKEAADVPIITVGGIRSPKIVGDVLSGGKADYVAMSRPFVREPHLVRRWKAGDTTRAACVSCNGCFETGLKGIGISCRVERANQQTG